MPLYTFHPCQPDGTSDTFLAVELPGEEEIRAVALDLMAQNPRCQIVEVWQDDREVAEFRRSEAANG